MELKELRYIVTLAEEGSISRAADRLFMAQSSLSQFLLQYEKELGTPLFARTAKGIRPTTGGASFIERAREILLQYRRAENELWDSVNLEGGENYFLEISFLFGGRYMLPDILADFQQKLSEGESGYCGSKTVWNWREETGQQGRWILR